MRRHKNAFFSQETSLQIFWRAVRAPSATWSPQPFVADGQAKFAFVPWEPRGRCEKLWQATALQDPRTSQIMIINTRGGEMQQAAAGIAGIRIYTPYGGCIAVAEYSKQIACVLCRYQYNQHNGQRSSRRDSARRSVNACFEVSKVSPCFRRALRACVVNGPDVSTEKGQG